MLGHNFRRFVPPAPVNINLGHGFSLYLTDASTSLPVPPSRYRNGNTEYFYYFNIPNDLDEEFRNGCDNLGFDIFYHTRVPESRDRRRGYGIVYSLGRGRYYVGADNRSRQLHRDYREFSPRKFYRKSFVIGNRNVDL